MEDLFGDSEPVHIPTMTPPIKGLAQRIDELHESGCCQKIAWSKSGCVASITPDGRGVNLRAFFRNSSDGKWILGEEIPLKIPQAHDDFPFVHISWGHIGTDLAVLDAAGRIFIFTNMYALGRMMMTRVSTIDQEDEMGAVVGMHWLSIIPHQQRNHIAWSANRDGNDWSFNISSLTFNDAHHPIDGKAALICVGRNGMLRLRFQQPDSSWQETSTELEHVSSSREPFTHAAFASKNDNSLLLVAHDVIGHLHIYRVQIHWTVPQPPKQGPPLRSITPPTFEVISLMVEDHCYPASSPSVDGSLTTGQEQRTHIPAQLTHLSFLPTTPEQHAGTLPTILAIFSHCPNPISSLDQTQPQQNSFSIIARWELHQLHQSHLHSSVDQVASKKKSASNVNPRQSFRLRRQPDLLTNSLVLSFFPVWYNMILVFCQSDGSVEFRNRASMDVITANYNQDRVSTLPQAGFAFSTLEPTLHIALSANHCIAAAMKSDGSVKLKLMEYTHGSLNSSEDDPKHGAAIAALVLQHTSACNQYFTSDDIFAVMTQEVPDARKRAFVSQAFRALNVNLDCVFEDAHPNALILMSRSPFIKCLSAQNLLGCPGNSHRSLTGKLAWAVLNVRYATQIMNSVIKIHGQIDKSPLRPEIAPSLVGLCRWMLHFMVWMLDELITLRHSLKNPRIDRATLQAKLDETTSPALILLLASFPRIMLKMWQQPLNWIFKTAVGFANTDLNPEIRRTYTTMHTTFLECPFEWRFFDSLVSEAIASVRDSYQKARVSDGQRAQMEQDMMLGEIPEALMPVARYLLTTTLSKLLDRLDPAKIMFFDTRWLGLDNSMRTAALLKTHKVDVYRKIVLKPRARGDGEDGEDGGEMKLKRCTRCFEYMEDFSPGQGQGHMNWLGSAKQCVCSNAWMIAEEKL